MKSTVVETKPKKVTTGDFEIARIERALSGESGSLPDIEAIAPPEVAASINEHLAIYNRLKREMADAEAKCKSIRALLEVAKERYCLPEDTGFKTQAGVVTFRTQMRKGLSEERLLTKISAADLAECYSEGEPYVVMTVKPT